MYYKQCKRYSGEKMRGGREREKEKRERRRKERGREDGCSGNCGSCGYGTYCNATGQCITTNVTGIVGRK